VLWLRCLGGGLTITPTLRRGALLLALGLIAGCAGVAPPSPAELAREDADTIRIAAKIRHACLGSGLFKLADGAVAAAVPAAELPVALTNAGVDLVCANPERFAREASTIEWLGRELKAKIAEERGRRSDGSE
jgi:hypothetical protein